MNVSKNIWLKKLSAKRKSIFNRDLFVFGFFFLLAFIFWYLNGLRKDIEADLNYPVRFVNPPGGMVVLNKLPSRLTLNLKGPGYSILMLKISGNRAPVVVDFSKVTLERLPGYMVNDKYVLTNRLVPEFTRQLKSEFQIVSIEPDTLNVLFGPKPVPSDNK